MSLDVATSSAVDLIKFIGVPVEIEVLPLSGTRSDTSVTGNVVAVDPETRSICLVQFYQNSVSHMVYVPGTSVSEVFDLSEGPFGSNLNYVENTPELRELIDQKFRKLTKNVEYTDEEVEQRKRRLLTKLESSCLKHEIVDDGKTIIVGAVKIRSPFCSESCFSENQLVLGRMRNLVDTLFEGTSV